MKIKEYMPESLLLKRGDLEATITRHGEKAKRANQFNNAKALFVSLLITLFSILIPGPEILSSLQAKMQKAQNLWDIVVIFVQLISMVSIICMIVYTLVVMVLFWKDRKHDFDLMTDIKQEVVKGIKYTGVILIADCTKRDEIRFLLGNYKNSDYEGFFPYFHMNTDLSIQEQEKIVRNCLKSQLEIEEHDICKIESRNNEPLYSIKNTAKSKQIGAHAFVFFSVQLNPSVKTKLQKNTDIEWSTLRELKQNPAAMAYNKDIIGWVAEMVDSINDSFANNHPLKIIWNMTNECNYACEICATRDIKRKELSFQEKITVLNSIASLGNRIVKIDFSGGDPCIREENLSVIQTAITMFGASKVSVTTTGKGLTYACALPNYRNVIQRCEITIDIPRKAADSVRGTGTDYYDDNIKSVVQHITHIKELTINVPIISAVFESEDITKLVDNIVEIKEHSVSVNVNLLRLMPVGAMANCTYPANYNPSDLINAIAKRLKAQNIDVSIHCSLKGAKCASIFENEANSSSCSMMYGKIGIDCSGNVFTCGWAGYLPNRMSRESQDSMVQPQMNPFYLGNVATSQLRDVLHAENNRYSEIHKRINRSLHGRVNYCPVVSYTKNPDWFSNNDPLHT